ncbi:MAG: ral stress protein 69 [Planctomycetota bacterium]|jgi:aryl-alcohol dehydrogenase-like predicted oxidoreductase
MMETRRLGESDLMITPIGIGAWAIGGAGWAFSWSHQDDRISERAIHAALDAGMNWIDTAAVYGLGHSEEVVAAAVKSYPGPKPYVFTKCERSWDENRQIVKVLKGDSIRRECENSLKRLQVETIDLYQIHWPEPDEDIEEGWETLAALRKEGKVRWIGVSNFNVAQMRRIAPIAPITSLQPPYSMVRREIEGEILPYVLAHNIGVLAYSPMGSGLLTGTMTRERLAKLPTDDWRTRSPHFQEPLLTRNLTIAAKVVEIADREGRTPGEIAIAWVLKNAAVTGAIVGIRTPEQVAGIAGGLDYRLDPATAAELDRFLGDFA